MSPIKVCTSCPIIKGPPLKYESDEKDPNQAMAQAMDCESVTTMSCMHKPH